MVGANFLFVAVFVIVTASLIRLVKQPHRWKVLLATSSISYYLLIGNSVLVVLSLAVISYWASFTISKKTRISFSQVIVILLAPLIIYKCVTPTNHFVEYGIDTLGGGDSTEWVSFFEILGLSYITFNAISYLVDIKRGYVEVQKNFCLLLLYLIYLPAVFSGPLHRAKYLFSEFQKIEVNDKNVSCGLRLILWGIFKNVVLAQTIYDLLIQLNKTEIAGAYYLIVGFMFFLYLYCNFSSFIDFFQGVSQIWGITLKSNFLNRVYLSTSRQQFWKGWHITLNEWFRDYFFFVASKYDRERRYANVLLLITFILIALWHELSLVLLIWGMGNGLWIVIEKMVPFKNWQFVKYRKVLGVGYHLCLSSLLALVFITPSISGFASRLWDLSYFPISFIHDYLTRILIVIFGFLIMDFHYARAGKLRFDNYLEGQSGITRWAIYYKLAALILIFGISGGVENYYIQF
ncbi:MAG: MBOAT family O-acyltransferase [Reichenbachiella sp.]|uniref:MBOAT family O-acyltransferase n=1 Tax=Reichenbachiella sp. TaxID=2184521 RepID=UPI002965DB2B|nr:MBOAT family O-acyltransferase [Reichenbachiella sp.]MDW3209679.1 MBOAT family O-acyltransferase [Reichenbachiella sp.]